MRTIQVCTIIAHTSRLIQLTLHTISDVLTFIFLNKSKSQLKTPKLRLTFYK
jgi:hypothetical protein